MKNRLKILEIGIGIILGLTLSFSYSIVSYAQNGNGLAAGETEASWVENGITYTSKDPEVINAQRNKNAPQAPDGLTSVNNNTDDSNVWADKTTGHHGAYTTGAHEMSREWLNRNNGAKLEIAQGYAAQITKIGESVTDDPQTAADVTAGGSYMASAITLGSWAHYGKIKNEFLGAAASNDAVAAENRNELARIEAAMNRNQIEAQQYAEKNTNLTDADLESLYNNTGFQNLAAAKLATQRAMETQVAVAESQRSEASSNRWMQGLTFLQAGALGYAGDMQKQLMNKLARDDEYCRSHPKDFVRGCTDTPPTPDNTRVTTPDPKPAPGRRPDNGFRGDPNRGLASGPGNGNGNDAPEFDALQQPDSGNGVNSNSDFIPSGLAGGGSAMGSGSGANPSADDADSESDALASGLTYGDTSGGTSLYGSGGMYDTASYSGGSSSGSSFDISQFLPAHLKKDDGSQFIMRKINGKKTAKKGPILGKDSPSLFTRIKKAYQKKSHELSSEVL